MSSTTAIRSNNHSQVNTTNVLDNRIARHTIGRVDAIFRTAIYAWAIAAQSVKLVLKCAICVLTLGQLSETFGPKALLLDAAFLVTLGYRTLVAVRDVFVAPKSGYVASPKRLITIVEFTLGGQYHDVLNAPSDKSTWEKAEILLKATQTTEPFLNITD